ALVGVRVPLGEWPVAVPAPLVDVPLGVPEAERWPLAEGVPGFLPLPPPAVPTGARVVAIAGRTERRELEAGAPGVVELGGAVAEAEVVEVPEPRDAVPPVPVPGLAAVPCEEDGVEDEPPAGAAVVEVVEVVRVPAVGVALGAVAVAGWAEVALVVDDVVVGVA